jgi:hypothetical protein
MSSQIRCSINKKRRFVIHQHVPKNAHIIGNESQHDTEEHKNMNIESCNRATHILFIMVSTHPAPLVDKLAIKNACNCVHPDAPSSSVEFWSVWDTVRGCGGPGNYVFDCFFDPSTFVGPLEGALSPKGTSKDTPKWRRELCQDQQIYAEMNLDKSKFIIASKTQTSIQHKNDRPPAYEDTQRPSLRRHTPTHTHAPWGGRAGRFATGIYVYIHI